MARGNDSQTGRKDEGGKRKRLRRRRSVRKLHFRLEPRMPPSSARQWPKVLPPLTPEQKQISDDFVKLWLEVLPRRYGRVEEFNHRYPLRHSPAGFRTTLEIGAGLGEHLQYETLTPEQEENYVAL